ncbi:MAG TPA: HlyD family secretion protein [Stellaceae bacterium]|nr:HlyD family secretion protein [Stellaceae bacterium]
MSVHAGSLPVGRRRPRRGWRDILSLRIVRISLMASLPLVIVLAGTYYYLVSGRYVSTDDAYVQSDKVMLSSRVAGSVAEVDVHDNELVKAGQVLFKLDDRPYRYALEQARARLASQRLQVDALRASYREKLSDLKAAQETVDFMQRQFDRNKALAAKDFVPKAQFDSSLHDLQTSQEKVGAIQQQIANILASLGGNPDIPTDQHPLVLMAAAQAAQAELDLQYATITAPADGIVSKVDGLQVGQWLGVGSPAFALLSTHVWVEANFKETDLTYMHPGDRATLTVDTYPGQVFEAHVDSISPGTGSEFSILPAQNATGNWVKVTQRVPVRVEITETDSSMPLRAGMSATVEVDTRHKSSTTVLIEHAFARDEQKAP